MSSLWRISRYLIVVICIFTIYRTSTFVHNQSAFQNYLRSIYITWDDFPELYRKALYTSHEDSVQLDTFDYTTLPPRDDAHHIPRIIHFVWFKNLYEERPDTDIAIKGSRAPEICKEHNPDFQIYTWNTTAARELLEQHYAWFIPTYEAYRYPIQRVDAIKYFLLYHYGGIYSDLDIACRRPLEPLTRYPAWFPEASPLGVNNDLFASRPKHPVLSEMINGLKKRNRSLLFPYLTIFWSTGPQFTSDSLKAWFLQRRKTEELQVPEDKSNSDPDLWYTLPQIFYSEEYTFFGHSPGGTWHESDVDVILWLVAHPLVRYLFLALAFTLLILFCLRRRITGGSIRNGSLLRLFNLMTCNRGDSATNKA